MYGEICDDYLNANYKNVDIVSLYAKMRWAIFAKMAYNKSSSLYIGDLDKWLEKSKTLTPVDQLLDEEKSQLMDFIKATPEEKQIQLLQEIGAPFIKNGKFVMDDESIEELFNAVKSDINIRITKIKSSKKYFKKEERSGGFNFATLKTIISNRNKKINEDEIGE